MTYGNRSTRNEWSCSVDKLTKPKINIHQIYYDEPTKQRLNPEFTPYYNPECELWFEAGVIRDLVLKNEHKKPNLDYFGVVGPKFEDKLRHWRGARSWKGISQLKTFSLENNNPDVISLLGTARNHNPVQTADRNHPKFTEIIKELLRLVDFNVDLKPVPHPIYCNFFVATPKFWEKYTQELMFPVMEIIEERREPICDLIYRNANYGYLPKVTQEKHGLHMCPYHPFITERLPNVFLMKYGTEYKAAATW